jgi:hypothetical protein
MSVDGTDTPEGDATASIAAKNAKDKAVSDAAEEPSPDRAKTHRRDGPYYVAPDSADPPPSGMWATLDPTAVEAEVDRVNTAVAAGTYSMKRPPEALCARLESGGPAARKLLASLKRSTGLSVQMAEDEPTPS